MALCPEGKFQVPHLVDLTEDECLDLLRFHSVGRIAVVREDRPLIFPVNYILDNRTVAFRTDAGTKLDWASMGPVAFEIDMTDAIYHEGWSVVVAGTGRDITEGLDDWSERVSAHVLTPWAGGAKDHWVAIASPVFSGRKIVQTEEEAAPTA
jgi:nitroimidazol reductase NimA-like FMN-containing flavoprotein (pyridoxamine 5'-phosphate oxidase superfamily)